jgi:hypothetical protein
MAASHREPRFRAAVSPACFDAIAVWGMLAL